MSFNAVVCDHSDLRIFECSAVKDDVYYVSVGSSGLANADMSAIAVYVEGSVEGSRVSGERSPGYPDAFIRTAGDTSLEFVPTFVMPGRLRYRVLSDTFKYVCLEDPKRRPLNARVLRYSEDAASSVTIPVGKHLYIAIGSAEIGGSEYPAPHVVTVESSPVSLSMKTPGSLVIELEAYP